MCIRDSFNLFNYHFIRIPERHTRKHQAVNLLNTEQMDIPGIIQDMIINLYLAEGECRYLQDKLYLGERGKKGFFGYLHIAEVARGQVTQDIATFNRQRLQAVTTGTQQLENIRIFFMRHNA